MLEELDASGLSLPRPFHIPVDCGLEGLGVSEYSMMTKILAWSGKGLEVNLCLLLDSFLSNKLKLCIVKNTDSV